MKKIGYGFIGLLLTGFALADSPRPNILYFYVDDMGWGAIGPNGQDARRAENLPSVKTPNIDSLAEAGVNFQRAYGCTVCSPARSSLMTGFHQGHTWADRNDTDNAKKAMRADDITLGDALKSAGYATGYWGKWGFGSSSDHDNPVILNQQTLPHEHGFDDVLAELHHVRAHTFFQPTLWSYKSGDSEIALIPNNLDDYINNADYPSLPAYQNDAAYPTTAYCDDYYIFRALDFVRTQAQQYNADGTPFFACLSPQIPHSPFGDVATLPEWAASYADDPHFSSLSSEAKRWAAMVTRIDAHFGNLLDALEDPNHDGDTSDSVAANTLVIFQSDNGGDNNNGRSELGSTDGLRGYKTQIWEGGIRVPMVMRWPSMITSNSTLQVGSDSQKVIDTTDMLPTFCELAGVEAPLGIDGVSLASFLMDASGGSEREFIIHEAQPDRSIIRGDMKLVDDSGALKLYDLGIDADESSNISGTHSDLVTELSTLMYDEWVAEPQWTANTYHDWTGADGGLISDADNWSDYIYSNQLNNIVYDSDTGAPQVSWVAKMHPSGAFQNEAIATADVDFLALEVQGASSNAVQLLNINNCTVSGRNEIRLKPYSRVELSHGTLASLRTVDLQTNAILEGSGTIDASLTHAGLLAVTGAATILGSGSSGSSTKSLLSNGGFELGTDKSFVATDEWFNFGPDQAGNARNTSNPNNGSYRGIVGNGSSGAISPMVDTGHVIGSNDTFTLSFSHGGAWNWDLGADTITATLYYNDGGEQILGSVTGTPTQDFSDGYDATGDQVYNATAASDGQTLFLRIESTTADSSGEFASVDDVELTVVTGASSNSTVTPARRECVIQGDYQAVASAELDVTLAGVATQAVDYAHVSIAGDAVLAGTLSVTVDPGFTPTSGDQFEILTANTISGEFDQVDDFVTGSDGTLFAISYTHNAVTLTATQRTAKGTPHTWLEEYGLVSEGNYEAADLSDTDFDGLLAWEEFIVGSDPTVASSTFMLSGSSAGSSNMISWPSVAGRVYRVSHTPDLTEKFIDVSGLLSATPPENSWNTGEISTQAFYTVGAELE